jgi:phage gp36-like protein
MYITKEKLYAVIPRQLVGQALNDDGVGGEDAGAWESVAEAVQTAIDGPLSQRYAVPFSGTLPPLVTQAALVLAAETIYLRRGISGDNNPWTARANAIREDLAAVASGEKPLGPQWDRESPSVSTITETAKTYAESGRLMI